MTDEQIHEYKKLHHESPPHELAAAVSALSAEALEARAAEAEGHRRMKTLAEQLRAAHQWTAFRRHRIHQAMLRPLRAPKDK